MLAAVQSCRDHLHNLRRGFRPRVMDARVHAPFRPLADTNMLAAEQVDDHLDFMLSDPVLEPPECPTSTELRAW